MITAFIIVGIIAAISTIAAIAACGMSSACATSADDDEQCAILAEQNEPRIIAFPSTVSASQ